MASPLDSSEAQALCFKLYAFCRKLKLSALCSLLFNTFASELQENDIRTRDSKTKDLWNY
jgi:hypothetical protein